MSCLALVWNTLRAAPCRAPTRAEAPFWVYFDLHHAPETWPLPCATTHLLTHTLLDNLCNSTTEGPDALCQTAVFNSIEDFCFWGGPGTTGTDTIGVVEAAVVAYVSG